MADRKPGSGVMKDRVKDFHRFPGHELDLSGLGLTVIPGEIFELTELQVLNLGKNKLSSIPSEISCLKNLAILDIGDNTFREFPKEICELNSLQELYIRTNLLTSLPEEIACLEKIEILDLSSNKLVEISDSIAALSALSKLYLYDNQISELPSKIGSLKQLTSLVLGFTFFGGNRLTTLPKEIGSLNNLTSLYLSSNKLSSLPGEIKGLNNLKYLDLGDNRFNDFPAEVLSLSNLKYLCLRGNRIEFIPKGIVRLQNLETLDMRRNTVRRIPNEIFTLSKLESLYLTSNKIKMVKAGFSTMPHLKELLLGKNLIEKLPPDLTNTNLRILELRENRLPIPPEILVREDAPSIIINYYFDRSREKREMGEVKLLLVGQGSVGKTSIVRRILHGTLSQNQTKTEGIEVNQWRVKNYNERNDNSQIKINIWDFGGQEIMHATHQFFLTKRSLYLLVLDTRLSQEENRVEYWLKIAQSFGDNSPVLIVGNKVDQHLLDIDRTGLQKKYPNIVGILETSAVTGMGIEELKAEIIERVNILHHVHDLLPESWFTVKTVLELLGNETNFITYDHYLDLCDENGINDNISQRLLLGFLHDLGIILHFGDDPRLETLGILNPQWVTNGVYRIVNSKNLFLNKGVLKRTMLDEILDYPDYPREKRLFIIDILRKFELCYDIEPEKTYLIPDLLPKDEPPINFQGIPAFEYVYPVLPSSIITRFIVRMSQHIFQNNVWRSGVMLKIGRNVALVKADMEDRKVTIAIDGVEHTRRDTLAAIRYQLDDIHSSIIGLNPLKRVPIPGAPNAEPLEYDYLLLLEHDGQQYHLVKNGDQLVKIDVRQVLSGIEGDHRREDGSATITNVYVSGDVKGSTLIAGDRNKVSQDLNKHSRTKLGKP